MTFCLEREREWEWELKPRWQIWMRNPVLFHGEVKQGLRLVAELNQSAIWKGDSCGILEVFEVDILTRLLYMLCFLDETSPTLR